MQGLRENYKPRKSNLTNLQQQELHSIVIEGPEAAGLDTGTWTAALVRDVIEKRFGVTYPTSAVPKILHRLSFSAQLPQVQLARADPRAQKKWVEKAYPAILRRSRKEGGVVFFQDECVFQQSGSRTRTWAVSGAQRLPGAPGPGRV
ncbi:MAG: winged helix-turn-helix domain-containing protein [Candidatus Eremiobacteraeota bacterium]|nr:winged helix-turn-helix domain-containing protein [Candidatus Eremiobacteraeota bacterium]MCW5868759.1 winged helix-turn-helix domain-containing protein [Candidatus Eremiobacteraeota bacterium]